MIPRFVDHFVWLDEQREAAGDLWEEHDLLFCQANGRPVDPRDDWQEFKDILADAGVRDARVHDGRQTAGTSLMEMGVDIRTVMEILGHSQRSTADRYIHVSSPMAREAMRLMGQALWQPEKVAAKSPTATGTATDVSRAARKRKKRRIV